MGLLEQLKKNSTIDETDILSKSKVYNDKEVISTPCPAVNIALGGSIESGLTPGVTVLAGPSKHFKTSFALLMASAFLKKYEKEDAVLLFYDSEFGTNPSYLKAFDIDPERVVHSPITDMEKLKTDIVNQLKELDKDAKLIIVIDSIGNTASLKELSDAEEGKVVADMTRAKAIKGLFRMITPSINLKNIPLIAVNHTYKEIGLYPKDVVSGGTGVAYSANTIWIIGRKQEKTGKGDLTGYQFIIKIEKSRFVEEGTKIGVSVSFKGGIQVYSGLLDIALVTGHVRTPSKGYFEGYDIETNKIIGKKVRAKDTLKKEFWDPIFKSTNFLTYIESHYKLGQESMIDTEALDNILTME